MKKVLCLLLVLLMSFTAFASADFDDLKRYGIMQGDPDGNLRLEDTVTRAEMAKIVIASMGLEGATREPVDTKFLDVTGSYWASGYIRAAQEQGIIHGKTDTEFAPEDAVTNEEAVKMLVITLGYDQKAEAKGGYPFGYMMTAEEIGLLNGLNLVGTANALRGDIASLVTNALDIPLMMQVGWGSATSWQIMDGKGGAPYVTLRTRIDPDSVPSKSADQDSEVPRFDGEEYVGRVLGIENLKQDGPIYSFTNFLNNEDLSTYIVNEDTYIYCSDNTVPLDQIADGMYAQVWYYTEDSGEIEVLKIEIMKNKPAGV